MRWRDSGDPPHGSVSDTEDGFKGNWREGGSRGLCSYSGEDTGRRRIIDYLLYLSRVLFILESAYPTACLFLTGTVTITSKLDNAW